MKFIVPILLIFICVTLSAQVPTATQQAPPVSTEVSKGIPSLTAEEKLEIRNAQLAYVSAMSEMRATIEKVRAKYPGYDVWLQDLSLRQVSPVPAPPPKK